MMFEKRPRDYAAEMMKAFRNWEKEWLEQVPAELRAPVSAYLNSEIAKAFSRSQWKRSDKKT
jgi:hypothetical protein